MSADTLTTSSRSFYERSKSKAATSFFLASAAMVFLGFCATTGGQAAAYDNLQNAPSLPNYLDNAYTSFKGGYGFAAFCFIVSFILALAAALYISPFVTGTNNEVKMLRAPQEIDTSYTAYNDNPSAAAPTV
jgi:Na+/proline symporter